MSGDERAPDGRRTRWAAHRAERRERIIDAGLAELDHSGPEFGLDQVAARAGVTKPVIYRFFRDRAALVDAMGDRATSRLADRMLPALYAETGIVSRIRAVIDALMRFLDESPNVYWLFAGPAPGTTRDVVRAHKQLVASALAGVLSGYIDELGVSAPPSAATVWAHGLVGFVQNTAEWWLQDRTLSRDEVTEQLTTMVWAQIEGTARIYGVALSADEPPGGE